MKFKHKQEVPQAEVTAPVGNVITEADLDKQILDYQNQLVQTQPQMVAIQGAIQAATQMKEQLNTPTEKEAPKPNGHN